MFSFKNIIVYFLYLILELFILFPTQRITVIGPELARGIKKLEKSSPAFPPGYEHPVRQSQLTILLFAAQPPLDGKPLLFGKKKKCPDDEVPRRNRPDFSHAVEMSCQEGGPIP